MPKLGRKTPCPGCPWLRISRRGYLGEDEPESFYRGAITNENDWPCHEQVDYSDPDWLKTQVPNVDLCAGQLIHFRNHLKMPRDPEMAEAVRAVKPSKHVFDGPEEFMRHHMPDADEATVERAARDAMWSCPQPSMADRITMMDLERQIAGTLGPEAVGYDIPGIAGDLAARYDLVGLHPAQSIQGEEDDCRIPDEDYWKTVEKYHRPPVTVTLPGKFVGEWLEGTGLIGDDYKKEADEELFIQLFEAASPVNAGKGYYMQLKFPATREGLEALEILINTANNGINASADDPDTSLRDVCQKVLGRGVEKMRVLEKQLGAPKAVVGLHGVQRAEW